VILQVKKLTEYLEDKQKKFEKRWKQVYLAALLGLDLTQTVKYLNVTAGFGKTWVIILFSMLLNKMGKKVCIVTVEEALRL
jgi:hypothetical protein